MMIAFLKNTVVPAMAIVVVGAALGLGFNATRTRNQIDLTRTYYRPAYARTTTAPVEPVQPTDGNVVPPRQDDADPGGSDGNGEVGDDPPAEPQRASQLPDHPFTAVTTEEALKLFENPEGEAGRVIFIDARDDQHFTEGHVPGAYQIDYYNINDYINRVLPLIESAGKVVVYCNGGDCEDSLLLCGELRDFYFVPLEKLLLYEGGIEAWTQADLPVERGRR